MLLQLCPHHRVHGHQAEDAGLADSALLMGVAAHEARDQLRELGVKIVCRGEGGNLGRGERKGGGVSDFSHCRVCEWLPW